ncbi:hypothetical protein FKM82_002572 [Ascaphus truei]
MESIRRFAETCALEDEWEKDVIQARLHRMTTAFQLLGYLKPGQFKAGKKKKIYQATLCVFNPSAFSFWSNPDGRDCPRRRMKSTC